MIRTIGCLSYTPLGYGTPQIQYLLRDLAVHYRVSMPVGVFAPRWESHPEQDEKYPDFFIHHFWPVQGHQAALRTPIPKLIRYLRGRRFRRIGVYGAGTHTQALREIWSANEGPEIRTLITSQEPLQRIVDGLPVAPVSELSSADVDFVVLSSQSFEREMAAHLRRLLPGLPFAALYDARLSNYPPGRHPGLEAKPQAEYDELRTRSAARWIEAFRPDLLVCTHLAYLQAVARARYRPRHLVYHVFELPGGSDGLPLQMRFWEEHALLRPFVSLVLHPEAERRRYYEQLFRWEGVPAVVIYNARPLSSSAPRRPNNRNGRVLIQGGLSADRNFIRYLVQRPVPEPGIDAYGQLDPRDEGRTILLDRKAARRNGFRYCGFLPNDQMTVRRREYAYLFVGWNPTSFDTLHACPNKFFEAIADGVPPIAAPHPQCREVIQRHDCGILLRDWSLRAFLEGLEEARRVFGTKRYDELVANCRRAHETELCWDRQFARIRGKLPKVTKARPGARRRRFVLLDPTLHDETGHHLRYAENVLSGAAHLGFETVAAINRMFEVRLQHASRLHPVYWYDFRGRNLGLYNFPRGSRTSEHFVEQTMRVVQTEQLEPGDEIFIPDISDDDLASLSRFLRKSPSKGGPRWHVIIRHDLPGDGGSRIRSIRALSGPKPGSSVTFYTDTVELAEQHERDAGVALAVLPIPVSAAPLPLPRMRWGRPLRVAYLGDACPEQGYHLLPELVRSCRDLVAAGKLEFVILAAANAADKKCIRATAELESLWTVGAARLCRERLPPETHEQVLRQAHVLLALYDRSALRRRSSHVVVEGLCSGKIVLVTKGSAPAGLLPPGSPWLCADLGEAASVLRRLASGGDSAASLLPSRRLRNELAAFHNGRRLAGMLTGRAADSLRLERTGSHSDLFAK